MPILEPAKVLRIWIAPWIDNKQDLHWPSMIFTEVTPRRWSIGGLGFEQVQALVPLQIIKPKSSKEEGDKQDDDIIKLFKAEQSGQMQQPSNTQKVQTIRIPDRSH
jgi:conjugal transfer pilus assembly protein TraV